MTDLAHEISRAIDARLAELIPLPFERLVQLGMGTVSSVEPDTCSVNYRGTISSGWTIGELEPLAGDRVRVGFQGSDRWIDSIVGRPVDQKIINGVVVFNVRLYGAKGDGVHDDTPAAQQAYNEAAVYNSLKDPAAGNDEFVQGATVYWPTGLYSVGHIDVPSFVTSIGAGFTTGRSADDEGAYLSRIKQRAHIDGPLFTIDIDTIGNGFYDLMLDGNSANQSGSTHHAIYMVDVASGSWTDHQHAKHTPIVRVNIDNFLGTGIYIGASNIAVRVVECTVSDCDTGIFAGATDIRIARSEVGYCTTYGVNVRNGAIHVEADIYHCGEGIHVASADGYTATQVMIADCLLGPQTGPNITIGSGVSHIRITGCILRNASQTVGGGGTLSQTSPGYAHIVVNSSNTTTLGVTGCDFMDNAAGGPFTTYDYNLVDSSAILWVSGNTHSGEFTTARTNAPNRVRTVLGVGMYVTHGGAFLAGGTSFPSMATNERYYRTDKKQEYVYDGTNKVATVLQFATFDPGGGFGATSTSRIACPEPDVAKWIERVTLGWAVPAGTLDGSNWWKVEVFPEADGGAIGSGSAIATFTLNSGSTNAWHTATVSVAALLVSNCVTFRIVLTKTGGPPTLHPNVSIEFRRVTT